jgi:hypothetical protein
MSGGLLADFSPRGIGFSSRAASAEFMLNQLALGQFLSEHSVSHCQCHSTSVPYSLKYYRHCVILASDSVNKKHSQNQDINFSSSNVSLNVTVRFT